MDPTQSPATPPSAPPAPSATDALKAALGIPAQPPAGGFEEYLFKIGAKKASYAVAKGATALVTSVVVTKAFQKFGLAVDPTVFTPAVAAAALWAIDFAHDYLKVKTGIPFL